MCGDNIVNEETRKSPDCVEVMGKAIVALAVFILTTCFFADYLFDIRGYIEDYGLEFKRLEIMMILLILIIFYFISKVLLNFIISLYRIFSGHKDYHASSDIQLLSSAIISSIFIWFLSPRFASILIYSDGLQKELLCEIISSWLFSILLINILLSSSRFKCHSVKKLSGYLCYYIIYVPKNWFNRCIKTLQIKIMGKNDD